MVQGNQSGIDPGLDVVVFQSGHCQGFDGVTQFLGVTEVLGLQTGNPLTVNILRLDAAQEGQRSQYGQLVDGIKPFYIVGGVGLSVAPFLGFFESLLKVSAVVSHAGEDVVGSAVDDAADGVDIVS